MTVKSGAQSGAVTLIQRFGSALNLNPHFHMLYLNGVYDAKGYFLPVKPPICEDLDVIAHTIARRVSRFLEKAGYLVRDAESEYLDLMQDEEDAMGAIVGASITYRLAFGPNAGRKALTLQTVPVRTEQIKGDDLVTKQAGFSLHAGIACKSHQRKKLERLCRYITRPPIAERRLSLANNGNVVIALKTAYDDGTTGTPSPMLSDGGPTQSHGVHGALSGAGAQTTGQPHAVSWGFFTQQQTAQVRRSAASCRRTREPETKGLLDDPLFFWGRSGSSVCSAYTGENERSFW